MRPSRELFAIPLLLMVVGCVSIDPRASREAIDSIATREISGEFSNIASYYSSGEFIADDNLCGMVIGYPAREASRVRLSIGNDGALIIECVSQNREADTLTFDPEDGFIYDTNGAISLKKSRGFVGEDGGFGYETNKIRMFINSSGDLAVVRSGGGGGFFGPFPIGVYAKHLSVFPRIKDYDP